MCINIRKIGGDFMRKKYLLQKALVFSLVGSMMLGLSGCGEKSEERAYESPTTGVYEYQTESGYYESEACDSAASVCPQSAALL